MTIPYEAKRLGKMASWSLSHLIHHRLLLSRPMPQCGMHEEVACDINKDLQVGERPMDGPLNGLRHLLGHRCARESH